MRIKISPERVQGQVPIITVQITPDIQPETEWVGAGRYTSLSWTGDGHELLRQLTTTLEYLERKKNSHQKQGRQLAFNWDDTTGEILGTHLDSYI